jgi:hypothetical protein
MHAWITLEEVCPTIRPVMLLCIVCHLVVYLFFLLSVPLQRYRYSPAACECSDVQKLFTIFLCKWRLGLEARQNSVLHEANPNIIITSKKQE